MPFVSASSLTFIPTPPSLFRTRRAISGQHASTPVMNLAGRLAATTALSALLLTSPVSASVSASTVTSAPSAISTVADSPSSIDAPHALVDEVWTLLNDYYVDATFNNLDWPAIRQELRNSSLPDLRAANKAARRLAARLDDRYTRVLEATDMERIRKFDVSGVGLLLTQDASGQLVVAATPIADSPAGRAGVQRGDVVIEVQNESVIGTPAFRVAELMQGDNGTDLQVTLRDAGNLKLQREYRAKETRPSVTKVMVLPDGSGGQVGYIRLREFAAGSREEVAEALTTVQRDGAQWVVLDLRGNGGGVFEGALEIAGLVEGDGHVVARVTGRGSDGGATGIVGDEEYGSRVVPGTAKLGWQGVELAVLVDGSSASASEVLAGGLRDECAAALVGERTFGKGVIQGVFGLSDGGGLVVTVAEYRTPMGRKIDGVGLPVDVRMGRSVVGKVLEAVGVTKLDEGGMLGVTREQVHDVMRMCREQRVENKK